MNIPEIKLPGLPADILKNAADVLKLCKKDPIPDKNFPYPYIAPGGAYGTMWWQLDFSIALAGMRYLDYSFCRENILNFASAQKEDGRIALWGKDRLPEYKGERLQREEVSSLPKLFDSAWKIASATDDKAYLEKILDILIKYLDWFRSARYDSKSGLFSAVFEETFIPYYGFAGEYAPVDLNVELLHGYTCTAKIARFCGKNKLTEILLDQAEDLRRAIHDGLWDEANGMFCGRLLKDDCFYSTRMASTFAALRCGIADREQKKKLVSLMLDPERFNWGSRPLASVDMTDVSFAAITTKRYFGNPCWSGNVWTLINENAVRGLYDCGEKILAAELAAKTVELFDPGFSEFLNPLTGDPGGVENYAWSAASCVDMIFSILFGIHFDGWKKEIVISPSIPEKWHGKYMSVKELHLPGKMTADIEITCGKVCSIKADIKNDGGSAGSYCGEKSLVIPF